MPKCMYCHDRDIQLTVADSHGIHHLCNPCFLERKHLPPSRTMTPLDELMHSFVSLKLRQAKHGAERREQEAMLMQRWDEMLHDVVTA